MNETNKTKSEIKIGGPSPLNFILGLASVGAGAVHGFYDAQGMPLPRENMEYWLTYGPAQVRGAIGAIQGGLVGIIGGGALGGAAGADSGCLAALGTGAVGAAGGAAVGATVGGTLGAFAGGFQTLLGYAAGYTAGYLTR